MKLDTPRSDTKTITEEQYQIWRLYKQWGAKASPLEKELRAIKKERDIVKARIFEELFGRAKTLRTPHNTLLKITDVNCPAKEAYSYQLLKEI